MKQSADNLFKKFDESAAYLQNTIDQRNNIWHNRGSYNYIGSLNILLSSSIYLNQVFSCNY